MHLVIVSGRSGSGKSSALAMLEDIGFYCVDNLPVGLLPNLANHLACKTPPPSETTSFDNCILQSQAAVGIDARNTVADLQNFQSLISEISDDVDVDIIYLDSRDDILIKRFSETRRRHPLSSNEKSLSEALALESDLLESIASMADLTIETSNLNLHDLRGLIKERIGKKQNPGLSILFQSFGFKKSLPVDSDLVFDVRCLPNPYWNQALRQKSGKDREIQAFLGESDDVTRMVTDIKNYLSTWIPKFEKGNRSYFTVSIGCTGGKHRSVYIAEQLAEHFSNIYADVKVRHKDLSEQ